MLHGLDDCRQGLKRAFFKAKKEALGADPRTGRKKLWIEAYGAYYRCGLP